MIDMLKILLIFVLMILMYCIYANAEHEKLENICKRINPKGLCL